MITWERQMKQHERAARARQKELQRLHKEMAKLTAIEQAKLEVAEFENQLDLLVSLHKEQSLSINWQTFGSLLPPCPPMRIPRRELLHLFEHARQWSTIARNDGLSDAAAGRDEDDQIHAANLAEHERQVGEWKRIRALAQRVHAGEPNAYSEALAEFSNLSEISNLGSSVQITVHSPHLIECRLQVNGREVIPVEVKSLTASGKVAVKAMPKGRFHEVYQDYVCSAVLRVARVIMATLPVHSVLITACVAESQFAQGSELPVLSVEISRSDLSILDYDSLDPSDTIERFPHRGDVLASRKTGEFKRIVPLAPAELVNVRPEEEAIASLIGRARELRMQIAREHKRLVPTERDSALESPVEA